MATTKSTYSPYQEEIVGLERQRDTMRKIREEAASPMQGQMVSGWYVSPSWTQGLANMLRGYIGKKGEERADADIIERQTKQKTDVMADMGKLAEIVRTGGAVNPGDFLTSEGQQQAMAQMIKMNEPYKLSAGDVMYRGGVEVARGADKPPKTEISATGVPYRVHADGRMEIGTYDQQTNSVIFPSTTKPAAQPPAAPASLAEAVRGDTAQPAAPGVTRPLPEQGFQSVAPLPPIQAPAPAGTPAAQPAVTPAPTQPTAAQPPAMPVVNPFAKPVETPKAPQSRTRDEGGVTITEQWNNGKWEEVSRAPRWQPKAGVEQKPLPATTIKLQDELLGQIGTAETTNAQLDKFSSQIASGKLNLGMFSNILSGTQNLVGLSSEASRNFASFKAMMEKMRNDSLRLNSGVQTEGDSQRAWNELLDNLNDPQVVQQRLAEIKDLNTRAIDERRSRIDALRENYGHAPYQPPSRRPSATAPATAPAAQPAPSRAQQVRPKGVGSDWMLKQDAKGNKAWVSPDGKKFVEAR